MRLPGADIYKRGSPNGPWVEIIANAGPGSGPKFNHTDSSVSTSCARATFLTIAHRWPIWLAKVRQDFRQREAHLVHNWEPFSDCCYCWWCADAITNQSLSQSWQQSKKPRKRVTGDRGHEHRHSFVQNCIGLIFDSFNRKKGHWVWSVYRPWLARECS